MRKVLTAGVAAVVASLPAAGAFAAADSPTRATSRAALGVRKSGLGRFIVDSRGRTLYLFEKDRHGRSSCYGSCAKVWVPYTTKARPAALTGVSASKIGTTRRRDGSTQVTYGRHPLYRYDDDKRAGQTKGQGSKEFGAEWYVVAPSGHKIDKS